MNSIANTPSSIAEAKRMLNALDRLGSFTFQSFADREDDRNKKSFVRTLHGDLDHHKTVLQALNAKGAGIYVTVNETDLTGRKASNIRHVRALFVDFDQARPERLEQLKALDYPPSMIVESSQGKHHAYWIVDGGEVALSEFTNLQKKLIQLFSTLWGNPNDPMDKEVDKAIHDLPRVLRLAGFWHHKEQPFMSRIVHTGEAYSAMDLIQWIEPIGLPEKEKPHAATTLQTAKNTSQIVNVSLSTKEIKLLARGRWVAILGQLGYAVSSNPNEHTSCPICGGIDRFRFDDQHGDGSYICSQGDGQTISGDGFALLSDHAQMGYKAALSAVTGALNAMGYISPFDDEHTKIDTLEGEVSRLSQLSEAAYALERTKIAKQLKIQVTILDKLVNAERKELSADANSLDMFPQVQLWEDEVDGAELLGQIESIIDRHIVCEPHTTTATALWIMFTWCIDAFQIAPIACITAPEKRCGKTQLLTVIGKLCYRPLPVANITAAAAFRAIDEWHPTLLVDEYDTFIKDNDDLRGIFNAGHGRENAFVIRTTGEDHKPTKFNVWSAKALSGIGHLPDTLKDRSIILELRRKQKDEVRQRLRNADQSEFEQIKQKLARWTQDNIQHIQDVTPNLPNELNDRSQDNWESLLTIADLLGTSIGAKARRASLEISGVEQNTLSTNEQILSDIRTAFEQAKTDKLFSGDLINRLCIDEDMPYAVWDRGRPISPRQLSNRLKGFGIKPQTLRIADETFKGYKLIDFKESFERYLPQYESP